MAVATAAPRVDSSPQMFARPATQWFRLLLLAVAGLDVLLISAATWLGFTAKFGFGNWHPRSVDIVTGVPLIDFGWIVPLWILCIAGLGGYSPRILAGGVHEFKILIRSSLVNAGIVSMLAYLANYDMSRGFFLYSFVFGNAFVLVGHLAIRQLVVRARGRGRLMRRTMIVGNLPAVRELKAAFAKRPWLGFSVVDHIDAGLWLDGEQFDYMQSADDTARRCAAVGAEVLVVGSGAHSSSDELRALAWRLEETDIDLIVVPSLLDVAGPRIDARPVSGLPLIHIEPPHGAKALRWRKAIFDRAVALVLIALLCPVILLVALAVKAEDGGPILFRQRRVGMAGRLFTLWKFRSMTADAEARHSDLVEAADGQMLYFKLRHDPRVTQVGAFIRRYSLDELPQLFNVLIGQMSLVGPRPQIPAEVAHYDDCAHRRLLVHPGVTGLWQVSGRSNLDYEESIRLDLAYVDNWSMFGDLMILGRTVRAVLRHEGAY